MPKKLKILIISFYYPPSSAVGALRVFALYKFLKKNGYYVDVISSRFSKKYITKLKYTKFFFKPSQFIRSIDRTVFSKFLFDNLKLIDQSKGEYDIIISSYKPIASVILGIYYKVISKNSILFVELRDLISQFGRKKIFFPINLLDNLIDRIFISFFNEIIVVSPASKYKAERFYRRKVNLIFNGIDQQKNYYSKANDKIYILYAGNLSNVRNLNTICNHIKSTTKQIELIVASNEDPKYYGGDYDFVNYIGFVDRSVLEDKIKISNYLLILEGYDKNSEENIPAKLFEYLSFNIPIMALCSEKSEIMNILNETNAGKNINNFNVFESFLQIKNYNPNSSIKKYFRENQFAKYLDLIEKYEKK